MGPRYLLRKGPAPWFSAPGLAPLGPNRTLLSCFPSRSDTRSGSCLTETPPVCSALCHHHVLPPLSPEPHSVERLWGPRTTAGTGRAQSQLGTGWWGGLLTSFWSAHVCIFFSSWAPSPNLRAQLSLLSASRASLRSCVPLATFCGAKSYSVYASRLLGTITRSLGLG